MSAVARRAPPTLSPEPPYAIGVDIGGTKLAAGLGTRDGTLLVREVLPTPIPADREKVLQTVETLISRTLDALPDARSHVIGIGVGTAGVVDAAHGVIVSSSDTLVGWAGTPVRSRLEASFGLNVTVDNDVNAMALAEAKLGAGRPYARLVVVAVGTGIGGALVCDGAVIRGATGTAGEMGHLPVGPSEGPRCSCGRCGHLESYASGPAMARRYAQLSGSRASDFRVVVSAAKRADPLARTILTEGATALGRGLAGVVNLFDPEAVILGGGVRSTGPLFMTPFRRAFRSELLPGPATVRLLAPRFRTFGGVVGAIALSLDQHGRSRHREAHGGSAGMRT